MFAVIKTGGKQYKVADGDVIITEKLDGDAGAKVSFDDVLMVGTAGDVKVGEDAGKATVTGEVLEQRLGNKIMVFKKKRRQNYRRKKGHRQAETVIRITGVKA